MNLLRTTFLAAALGLCAAAGAADDVRQLEWDDLMPKDWNPYAALEALTETNPDALVDGSPEATAAFEQFVTAGRSAPVVGALDGQKVKLPGFVVPLDFIGTEVSEFLLVPYFGACIHVPPPPSNQIVYVKSEEPRNIKEVFEAVWVTGTLRTEAFLNVVGDAGYTLEASGVEPYRVEQ